MDENMTSLDHINKLIRRVSKFIVPLLPLASCHMVDYITANHWENLLPEQLRKDLLNVPRDQLQHMPSASLTVSDSGSTSSDSEWSVSTSDLPSFLSAIREHSLPSLGVITPIDEILRVYGPNEVSTLSMKGIMSPKKSHEVEVMSQVVSRLANGCGVEWIIDLGSGRGYLSTSLVLQYNLNVVAIDSSDTNTSSAMIRKKKLQKYWKNIKKSEQDRLQGKPMKKGKHRRRRKPPEDCKNDVDLTELTNNAASQSNNEIGRHIAVTAFITEGTDLLQIVKDSIEVEINELRESVDNISLEDCKRCDRSNFTNDSIENDVRKVCCDCDFSKVNNDKVVLETDCEESLGERLEMQTSFQGEGMIASGLEPHLSTNLTSQYRFPQIHDESRLGLVGLHTCGNLAPSSLRLYLSNPKVTFLCNIGCCYHLMEEEFSRNPFLYCEKNQVKSSKLLLSKVDDTGMDFKQDAISVNPMHPSKIPNLSLGFPLSKTLRNQKFSLGRNCRMLSCQPADRLNYQDKSSTLSLYWRSLLQVLLLDKIGDVTDMAHVGRIAAKCQDFPEYARMAFTKLEIDIEITEEELQEYSDKYADHIEKLERFFFLRASLAPIVEGLILLDRLAFLYEQDIGSTYLVQLFDPITSPRCHALIAFKKSDSSR